MTMRTIQTGTNIPNRNRGAKSVDDSNLPQSTEQSLSDRLSDANVTVYIVDDDSSSLVYYSEVLQRAGFQVECFQRGEDFLGGVQTSQPGCVLLDVRMPRMSGLELQQKLAERDCAMPIILISGDADVESCSQGFRAGAFDFVEKSISTEDLIDLTSRAAEEGIRLHRAAALHSLVQARTELLTAREKDVKALMLQGCSIKEIAFQLNIAFQTAAKHRSRVLEKMEVDSDAELIRLEAGHAPDPDR